MLRKIIRAASAAALLAGTLLFTPGVSFAQNPPQKSRLKTFWAGIYGNNAVAKMTAPERALDRVLLAHAQPDESFRGVGVPYGPNPYAQGGIPKVNQAYVWGLAKAGDNLWFGTVANTLCLVIGALMLASGMEEPYPIQDQNWVCEFGQSDYSKNFLFGLLPAYAGDFRPPEFWMYNTKTGVLTEKTGLVRSNTNGNMALNTTVGIRSAGTLNNVVFFGGPNFTKGITLYAFNAVTGQFIGAQSFDEYKDIRQWLVVDNVLYTGVGNADGSGNVLRWTGNTSSPFRFDVVGHLDSDAAYIVGHEGRIFASTWPALMGSISEGKIDYDAITLCGLYMSPVIPPGGLTTAHAGQWAKVWDADDYEADPVTAVTYAGGAMASFGGWLYWGTMNVPLAPAIAHLVYYAQQDSGDTYMGTFRPISIFRGRNFDAQGGQLELLYGLEEMPVYTPDDPADPKAGGSWNVVPNAMGQAPLYGPAGFGNPFNDYTWSMAVFQDELFVGTMDWSMLFEVFMDFYGDSATVADHDSVFGPAAPRFGADVWRFLSADAPAFLESGNGMDNFANYGIRTMVSADRFYLGSANPMNLMTNTGDALPPGGWELIELVPCACDVDDPDAPPAEYALLQNYPNPFNPSTEIRFDVREKRPVLLRVFDTRGREVAVLVDEVRPAGTYVERFDAGSLAAGVYVCEIAVGEYRAARKMVLMK